MAHVADVVIQNAQVPADATDFVVYVDLSSFGSTSSFWTTVANGGGDIRCYKVDGTTELAREVVSCDTSTDTGELHVKFSGTLSGSIDTVIQIHADGSSSEPAVSATYGRNAVWSDYAAVYHLEGNGATQTDSTGGGLDLTATSTTDATGFNGVSGGGLSFNGTTSKLLSTAGAAVSNNSSISAWATSTDNSAQREIAGVSNSSSTATLRRIGNDNGEYWSQHRSEGGLTPGESFSGVTPTTSYDFIAGKFFSSAGKFASQVSVNGAAYSTAGLATSNTVTSNENQTEIGVLQAGSPIQFYSGSIDEVRFRSGLTTEDWLATEYTNQNTPNTFYTVTDVAAGTHVANITIDNTQVDADLTDFVVFIDLSDLPTTEFWGTVANGGGDIRCYKSDGTTQLAREVVSCDTATDTGELHVKFTGTLSSTVDTVIQIWTDGSSSEPAVTATYGRNSVWSDYDSVYHGDDLTDSTGNGYTLTAFNGALSGQSGGLFGSVFGLTRASTQYFTASEGIQTTDPVTMQGLFYPLVDSSGQGIVSLKDTVSNNWQRLTLQDNAGGNPVRAQESDGSSTFADTTVGPTYAAWNMAHAVFNTSGHSRPYINGGNSALGTQNTVDADSNRLYVGAWDQNGSAIQTFGGYLDEIRVRPSELSAAWISTEYNNQTASATFYTATAVGGGGGVTARPSPLQILDYQYAVYAAVRLNGVLQ